MSKTQNFRKHSVDREDRADGSILLRSTYKLGPVVDRTGDWLHMWSDKTPDAIFLAERSGEGWREETYLSTLEQVRSIASALLGRGLNKKTPILIMSGNGVDHGLLALAAQYVGVPIVPIAEQYALIPAAHARLLHAIELVEPKAAYVSDADQYAEALNLDAVRELEIFASNPGSQTSITAFSELLKGDNAVDLEGAVEEIGPDTIAKILLTSGSTSNPKGVITTHRMMCTNQTQIADALPFLRDHAPRILDWLPWNHVFGGSHNFNMMLANGGSLYIDEGKPVEGLFNHTLENLKDRAGTLCFNVPVGFSMLLRALSNDADLRQRFFEDLDLVFYAGASLPQDVWQGFEQMAVSVRGEVPLMTSSWGLTETAPATLLQHEPIDRSGIVGVPLNGTTIKLIPDADMRCEVRVTGPNVMPGYFNDPVKTAEAFDDEGFFITGDAMVFVDPSDVEKGMRFDGRLSEDFKLLTGTWVRSAQLRLEMLGHLAPLASDIVVTGADRDDIGLIIFPNRQEADRLGSSLEASDDALVCPILMRKIQACLIDAASNAKGSSTRVVRAIIAAEPPSMAEGEMTAKGNLNFRKVLQRRANLLRRLYDEHDSATIRI